MKKDTNIFESDPYRYVTVREKYTLQDYGNVRELDVKLKKLLKIEFYVIRPAGPVNDNYIPGPLHSEGPGFMFAKPIPISGKVVNMQFITCVHAGPFYWRDWPVYWDRTGSRHVRFGQWTFFHLYVGQTPKNR